MLSKDISQTPVIFPRRVIPCLDRFLMVHGRSPSLCPSLFVPQVCPLFFLSTFSLVMWWTPSVLMSRRHSLSETHTCATLSLDKFSYEVCTFRSFLMSCCRMLSRICFSWQVTVKLCRSWKGGRGLHSSVSGQG
jgi:hypothetical protein